MDALQPQRIADNYAPSVARMIAERGVYHDGDRKQYDGDKEIKCLHIFSLRLLNDPAAYDKSHNPRRRGHDNAPGEKRRARIRRDEIRNNERGERDLPHRDKHIRKELQLAGREHIPAILYQNHVLSTMPFATLRRFYTDGPVRSVTASSILPGAPGVPKPAPARP
jgi:hypothetical protein